MVKMIIDKKSLNAKNYLCESNLEIFDLDCIKEIKYNEQAGIKSPDAIFIKNKSIFIIEFRNQNPCDINSKNLQWKIDTSIDFFKNMDLNVHKLKYKRE